MADGGPTDGAVPVEATLPGTPVAEEAFDDEALRDLVARSGVEHDQDLVLEILETGLRMGLDPSERLDLKIASSALVEMRAAFRLFAAYRHVPKVTIFGSARTKPSDPGYRQAHDLAAELADRGWMVVTGAGPGIMQAAMEGAGADRSIGVSIRLPFETEANSVIAGDPKLVSMKYFFTRKLMLVKESQGFVSVPGGFGTLDETFELLTLQQTGKAVPAPLVLLDHPGGTYWHGFQRFVTEELVPRDLVAGDDLQRALVTDSIDAAVEELTGFYRNYDSLRWVGDRLVLRLCAAPTDEELAALAERFAGCLLGGTIERTEPLPPEVKDDDKLDLPRIALRWAAREVGELFQLIAALNALGSAPDAPHTTPPIV